MILPLVLTLTVMGALATLLGAANLAMALRESRRAARAPARREGLWLGLGGRTSFHLGFGVSFLLVGLLLSFAAGPRLHWWPTDAAPPATGTGWQAEVLAMADKHREAGGHLALVVGVLREGEAAILPLGRLRPGEARPPPADLVLPVGSVTKVLSGVLFAEMVQRGELALEDPLDRFLPPGVAPSTPEGREIRLVDLAAHTSGLPRLPPHMGPTPAKVVTGRIFRDPYRGHTWEELLRELPRLELSPPGGSPEYSNLGAGLLGHALERAAGRSFETLVRERVAAPLGMEDTWIDPPPSTAARLAPGSFGHVRAGRLALSFPARRWEMPVLVAAGGMVSSVEDLLRFARAVVDPPEGPLGRALTLAARPRASTGSDGQAVALGWMVSRREGEAPLLWHDGATGGYASYLGVIPEQSLAVVVLANTLEPVNSLAQEVLALLGAQHPQGAP